MCACLCCHLLSMTAAMQARPNADIYVKRAGGCWFCLESTTAEHHLLGSKFTPSCGVLLYGTKAHYAVLLFVDSAHNNSTLFYHLVCGQHTLKHTQTGLHTPRSLSVSLTYAQTPSLSTIGMRQLRWHSLSEWPVSMHVYVGVPCVFVLVWVCVCACVCGRGTCDLCVYVCLFVRACMCMCVSVCSICSKSVLSGCRNSEHRRTLLLDHGERTRLRRCVYVCVCIYVRVCMSLCVCVSLCTLSVCTSCPSACMQEREREREREREISPLPREIPLTFNFQITSFCCR